MPIIVLPWLGEGIAGSGNLGTGGMLYLAFAHTIFFVLLAVLYASFTRFDASSQERRR